MPRRQRQRPSPEAAVSASPFFDLPLEIRQMIYKLLLVHDYGLAIAHDAFKRTKPRRDSNRPCTCTDCGMFFTNNANLARHIKTSIHYVLARGRIKESELPDLPNMNTQILRVCRLVHDEATPILYQSNSFCFSDPHIADAFRWGADTKYACSIQEIRLSCASTYEKQRYPSIWKDLSQNFPQLKRLSIRLITPWFSWQRHDIDSKLEELARHFRGLDWVHVQDSGFVRSLKMLYPMVEKDSGIGPMHIQKHTADTAIETKPATPSFKDLLGENFLTRWDVTLWWGRDGQQAPKSSCHIR